MKTTQKLAALLLTAILLSGCGEKQPEKPKEPGKYAETAKCLTQKGVIMYGTYWCPHCLNQKEAFGDDVQFIHYQECDDKGTNGNHKACLEAGVTSYPTWYFPGQGNLVGEASVAELAKLANCQDKLPQEDQNQLKEAEKKAEEQSATAKTEASQPTTTQPEQPLANSTAKTN